MKDLIEALQIFRKYRDVKYPTHCEHDVLYVVGIEREAISAEDVERLDDLGFHWMSDVDCWGSFTFGSA